MVHNFPAGLLGNPAGLLGEPLNPEHFILRVFPSLILNADFVYFSAPTDICVWYREVVCRLLE